MTGLRRLAMPQALWFFYAGPDCNMPLTLDQPHLGMEGCRGRHPYPPIPLEGPPLGAGRAPCSACSLSIAAYGPPSGRRLGSPSSPSPLPWKTGHIYTVDWQRDRVRFYLDGGLLLESDHSPAGPLGLVIWLDNQYLQFAPWGHFRWGLVAKEECQWLEVDWLAVDKVAV